MKILKKGIVYSPSDETRAIKVEHTTAQIRNFIALVCILLRLLVEV